MLVKGRCLMTSDIVRVHTNNKIHTCHQCIENLVFTPIMTQIHIKASIILMLLVQYIQINSIKMILSMKMIKDSAETVIEKILNSNHQDIKVLCKIGKPFNSHILIAPI